MRLKVLLLVLFVTFCIGVRAQQARSSTTTAKPARQDVQAVTVITQALTVGGGATALKAIADYTASGNITYHEKSDVQGTVTMKGLGSIAVRLDASLPSGTRSWAIHDGVAVTKREDGKIIQFAPNPKAPSSDAFPYVTPLFPSGLAFPYRQLSNILGNPSFGLSYKGIVQADAHSVHDVQAQRVSASGFDPMSKYHIRDFFIDTATLQIVMIQDTVPKNVVHQVHYSNYNTASAVLVPFTISEQLGGQSTWTVQLTQFTFNSGLQDSDFALQ